MLYYCTVDTKRNNMPLPSLLFVPTVEWLILSNTSRLEQEKMSSSENKKILMMILHSIFSTENNDNYFIMMISIMMAKKVHLTDWFTPYLMMSALYSCFGEVILLYSWFRVVRIIYDSSLLWLEGLPSVWCPSDLKTIQRRKK